MTQEESTRALDENAQAAASLPARIGPYRILGVLGEGGMGRVYLAREEHPPREVALKVVRGVSQAALARFQREIALLAHLEHSNIVRLYAAGQDNAGGVPVPWFALEYVRGPDLRGWLARERPALAARLRLLVQTCRAVHHAHQRGVIHRDLKPSNLLVDVQGQPRILDFGIARLHGEADGDMTQAGQVLGTLPYMSPEQLAGRGRQADARSDVYALGVIAYELVAGRLPHPRLSTSSLFEALDIVRREEAPRLGTLAPEARGDLDTVVMKAIASEASQRYASAAAFADDLENLLAHRPVLARPPTLAYKTARFVRRHRALTAAATIVFAALLATTIVSTFAAQRARAALAEARARADELAAINGFVENMLADADPELGGSPDMPLREVLQRAGQALQAQAAGIAATMPSAGARRVAASAPGSGAGPHSRADARVRSAGQVALLLGRTWSGLGESTQARAFFDRADTWLAAGFGADSQEAQQARFARIEDLARSSQARAARDAAQHLENRLAGIDAAWARDLAFRARIVRAEAMEEAGEVEPAIALDRALLADPQLARLEDAEAVADVLRHNLAYALLNSGNFPEAERLTRATLASESKRLGPDHPQVLYTKKTLGQTLHRQGRLEEAVQFYAEVYDKRRVLYGDEHALTLNSGAQLAAAYNTLGRPAEAEPLLRRALATRIARGEGETQDAIIDRVMLVTTLDKLGRPDAALAMADAAIALEKGEPNRDTVAARNARAALLLEAGRVQDARAAFAEVLKLAPDVIGTEHPNWPVFLASAAGADLAAGDAAAARTKLEQAVPLLEAKQGLRHPRTQQAVGRLAETYDALGLAAQAESTRAKLPSP